MEKQVDSFCNKSITYPNCPLQWTWFLDSGTVAILKEHCRTSTNQFKGRFRLKIKGLHISGSISSGQKTLLKFYVLWDWRVGYSNIFFFFWNAECKKGKTALWFKKKKKVMVQTLETIYHNMCVCRKGETESREHSSYKMHVRGRIFAS